MTFNEYLENDTGKWFLTGKKEYTIRAMMVSRETSFQNDLEVTDYTATDDGETVVLKGTMDEMWTSPLSKVMATYTRTDGSALSLTDFSVKDEYIDITTIPAYDTNFAMFVPKEISVTVETARGDVLHTNLPNAEHGKGDFLVCKAGENGSPDLSDVWVVNGALFPKCYDMTHAEESDG